MKRADIEIWGAHRAALAPSLPNTVAADATRALRQVFTDDENVVAFLAHHGLAGIWHQWLSQSTRETADAQDRAFLEALKPNFMANMALHALQNKVTKLVTDIFDERQIAFVFLKTAGVRDELYDSLGLRPCTDLDMLVAPADRHRAESALAAIGARLAIAEGDDSARHDNGAAHESTWQLGLVDIDLHWDILGAGRLPPAVTTQILARRKQTSLGWRPDDTDCLFIALVHPAFAKHVCSRHMGLNRVNDTIRMLARFQFDTAELVRRLREAGVMTAAQASLYWLSLLAPSVIKTNKIKVLNDISHSLRQQWLRFCIDRNLPDRWVETRRTLLNALFTIWLHDSAKHALRALRGATSRLGTVTAPSRGSDAEGRAS